MENSKKRTVIFLIMIFSALFGTVNETFLNVALIDIANDLNVTAALAQWLVTAYMMITAIMVPITAFLYQTMNTKRLHMFAIVLILVGAVGCFFAPVFPMLLIFRMIQAAGTGMIMPVMMNVVLQVTPKEQIASKLALCNCAVFIGPALGPVIGGFLMQFFSWRSCFVFTFIVMAILLILSAIGVENISIMAKIRLDVFSIVLSSVGLAIFLIGVSIITSNTLPGIALIIVGMLILGIFAYRQTKLEMPMLNISPLKDKRFVLGMILTLIAMMILFSLNALLPTYFQGALGVTSMTSALLLIPAVFLNAMSTTISGKIIDKRGLGSMLTIGFAVVSVGLIFLTMCNAYTKIWLIILILIVAYQGLAFTMSPAQTSALSILPKEMYPHGVGLINTFLQVSAAIGSSLFGGIKANVQANDIAMGIAENEAISHGFSVAMIVAVIFAVLGLLISLVYARYKKRAQSTKQ